MKDKVKIKVVNDSGLPLPAYARHGDAGMDLRSTIGCTIHPGDTRIINTGLRVEIPYGYEIQIRPRSGMGAKTKMRIANSPGTIDHGYRNFIGVIMENIGTDPYEIVIGDRIAQAVLSEVPFIEWDEVDNIDELSVTDRGEGGFGSSGKQ